MNKTKNLKYIITIVIMLAIVFTNKVNGATGKVTTETLNLRSEPSTSSSVVELLNADEELEILSEEGNWYKVKHGSKEGYVSKDYVKVDETLVEEPDTTTEPTITGNENITSNPDTTNSGIVNNETVTLKKDTIIKILPLINASSIGEAKSGEEITIITSANKWVFIQTDELSGWILNPDIEITTVPENNEEDTTTEQEPENSEDENLEEENQEDESQEQEEKTSTDNEDTAYTENTTKYVNASSIYVRSKPSTDSDIVTTLIKNTDVTVTGESGDWYKVKYGTYTGYIYKELLSDTRLETTNRSSTDVDRTANISNENQVEETDNISSQSQETSTTSSKGEEVVEYAKQYLGCPYVYGGSGSSSFDCSGFTMYVYKNFGYSLSHSAIAQSKVGTYVEKENLQPGDLVFFLEWDTMDEIGHCGIYIGDGDFIHASSGSGYCVKISNLNSGSYSTRYATARRLI